MTDRMHRILESKRALRKELAALPFSEKVKILEQLRNRSVAIQATPLARKERSSTVGVLSKTSFLGKH